MKTTLLRLSSLVIAIIPLATAAQTNIKAAFDAIIKCPEARITESHTFDKDPSTNVKTGQSDVYRFVLPANKIKLVENVITAFDKDSRLAYSINRGTTVNTESDVNLAIGDGSSSVTVTDPGCDYLYSLYLPSQSEDPEGKYRYAYGINWKEKNGNVAGKLIVTYATTLKHRQQVERNRQFEVLRMYSNGSDVVPSIDSQQQTWFETLMSYFQSMSWENSKTRIALATKAYKVICDVSKYPEVTSTDKATIREILEGMISDDKYSETILNRLLRQCLFSIK